MIISTRLVREQVKPFAMMTATFAMLAIAPNTAMAQSAQQGDTVAQAFRETIPNIPGKSIVGVVVDYKPGEKSPAHRHAGSAFIVAYVLSGSIRSQVDGGEVKVFRTGEHWTEQPGAHHQISENASTTEPAKLLAIFVVDSKENTLTTYDK